MKKNLDSFFLKVILPKVLTNNQALAKGNHPSEDVGIFCFCRHGEFQQMILCENPECKFGWFHFSCVNLTVEPTGTWFFPDCTIK
jgi:chromatin modification-related protein YNG2